MAYVLGHGSFAVDVLTALGIDPDHVTGFDLHCHVGEVVTITVDRIVEFPDQRDAGGRFVGVMTEYAVIEKGTAADAA